MKSQSILRLSLTALMSALCYIGFQYLKIDIPLPTGAVAIHFGNAFCVLGALLLGGIHGGLAGAIGMTLGDLFNPLYITSAPKTFLLKFCIGYITGFVAHHIAKVSKSPSNAYTLKWTIIASSLGMGFNVIFEPIISYLYNHFLLGASSSAAKILATWLGGVSLFNAVTSVIIATTLYMVLRKHIKIKV